MSQDHHFLPQVYLRAWCHNGKLLRYRRVGPSSRLEMRACSPRGIAYESDLYAVPPGASANGLAGNDVEAMLAQHVDARLSAIVANAGSVQGRVTEEALERDIRWLLRTFQARSSEALQRVTAGSNDFLQQQSDAINRMIDRARPGPQLDLLRSFLDPRRPRATALAGLQCVSVDDLPADLPWLAGDAYVVSAAAFRSCLALIGVAEFVTSDTPVVEWRNDGPTSPLATFALSPDAMVIMTQSGYSPTLNDCLSFVVGHTLAVLPHRHWLISRSPVQGETLARAGHLKPDSSDGSRGCDRR